jgi:hypothetical protein
MIGEVGLDLREEREIGQGGTEREKEKERESESEKDPYLVWRARESVYSCSRP